MNTSKDRNESEWSKTTTIEKYIESKSFDKRVRKLMTNLVLQLRVDEDIVETAVFDVLLDALNLSVKKSTRSSLDTTNRHTLACFENFETEDLWWNYLSLASKRRAVHLIRAQKRLWWLELSAKNREEKGVVTDVGVSEIAEPPAKEACHLPFSIQKEINLLPGKFPALVLGILDGKTYTEIAAEIGVSKSRVSRMVDELPKIATDLIKETQRHLDDRDDVGSVISD